MMTRRQSISLGTWTSLEPRHLLQQHHLSFSPSQHPPRSHASYRLFGLRTRCCNWARAALQQLFLAGGDSASQPLPPYTASSCPQSQEGLIDCINGGNGTPHVGGNQSFPVAVEALPRATPMLKKVEWLMEKNWSTLSLSGSQQLP